jgi:hypothetical protein
LIHEKGHLYKLHNQVGRYGLAIDDRIIAEVCLTGSDNNNNIISVRETNAVMDHFMVIQIRNGLLLVDGQPISAHREPYPRAPTVKRLAKNVNLEMSQFKMTISVNTEDMSKQQYDLSRMEDKQKTTTRNPIIKIGKLSIEEALRSLDEYEPVPEDTELS